MTGKLALLLTKTNWGHESIAVLKSFYSVETEETLCLGNATRPPYKFHVYSHVKLGAGFTARPIATTLSYIDE